MKTYQKLGFCFALLASAHAVLPQVAAADGNAGTAADAQAEPSGNPDPIAVVNTPETAATPSSAEPARLGVGIEEIIVTAQKKEESVDTVPISISAFSGGDLKALGVTDTRDLSKLVPGFTAADSGYNTPVYTLRGVGFNDSTYTATSTVGVYVDEVALPYSVMTKGAALDLQRVEVLKGPQGLLYGRNTTGGVINYIANKPTDDFEAGATETFSRFDTVDAEGFVSGNLIGGINGRLAVKETKSFEGWQYSNTRPDDSLGKKDKQVWRGSLEWAATDDLKFSLVTQGWRDRSDAQASQAIQLREQSGADPTGVLLLPPQARNYPFIPVNGADPRVADWPTDEPWQLKDGFWAVSLRSDWQITDQVKFITILDEMRVSSDGSEIPASGYDFNNDEQVLNAFVRTTALETRLTGTFGDDKAFDWTVGGNLSRDQGSEDHLELLDYQSALAPDPVTGQSTLTNRISASGTTRVDQEALFLNGGWHVTDTVRLSGGARYTNQSNDFTACTQVPPEASYDLISGVLTGLSASDAAQYTATHPGEVGHPTVLTTGDCFALAADGSAGRYRNRLAEDNLSFRLAVDWQPVDQSLLYASVGRGYKAGGFPVLAATGQSQYVPVKQEKLLAFETGSKNTFFDHQVRANAALYYYLYDNKQLLSKERDPVFGPLPLLLNAPKSDVYGAELELNYAPTAINGLFLAATGAYVHTQIKQFEGLDSSGNQYDFAGRSFNYAPRLQFTLVANQVVPVSEILNFTMGVDYFHSSSTSSALDPDPIFKLPAYGLLGARAGVASADKRWSLEAFARNLTNELYVSSVLQNGDAVSRYVGFPRNYGLTASYNWK